MGFSAAEQSALLQVARASIAAGLQTGRPAGVKPADYPPPLTEQRASFVTLTLAGELRGCIGSLEAHTTLVEDVARNAFAAAFRDPRFPALQDSEFNALVIQISVLGTPEPVAFESERELLDGLLPGTDGLILQEKNARGTFLPSVWGSLPRPEDFLNHLKMKAGLPAGYWSDTIRVWRYTTESFSAPAHLAGDSGGESLSAG